MFATIDINQYELIELAMDALSIMEATETIESVSMVPSGIDLLCLHEATDGDPLESEACKNRELLKDKCVSVEVAQDGILTLEILDKKTGLTMNAFLLKITEYMKNEHLSNTKS